MRLTPKTQQGAKRLAKPELRQPDRAKPLQNPAVELLKRIDLLQDRGAVLSQRPGVRRTDVRKPHQGAGMRAQRKQIRSELVMQFARDLLALDILERHRPLG